MGRGREGRRFTWTYLSPDDVFVPVLSLYRWVDSDHYISGYACLNGWVGGWVGWLGRGDAGGWNEVGWENEEEEEEEEEEEDVPRGTRAPAGIHL